MNPDIGKQTASDGTIDEHYTWGRPVTTYLSTLQHMRLLLLKARIESATVAEFLMGVPRAWDTT
jgi:hypothetical protein